MDQIQERILEEVADLHGVPEGAYNIRANGQMDDGRLSFNGKHCRTFFYLTDSQTFAVTRAFRKNG